MANAPDLALYARITLMGRRHERRLYDPPGRLREDFWQAVSELSGKPTSPEWGESLIQENLGLYLAKRFSDRVSDDSPLKARSRSLPFHVKVLEYGSALCKIEVPGLDTVTKIVDDNYDLFMFLTGSHASTGFEQLFGLPNGSVKTEVQAPEAVRSAFLGDVPPAVEGRGAGTVVPPIGPGGGGGANDPLTPGEKRLQRIIKGTLVIVLIALIAAAWLLAYAWSQERDIQKEEREHVANERKALLDLAASEVKIVSERDVELARAVEQGGASEVVALVHAYGALAHDAAVGACCHKSCCPGAPSKKKPPPLSQCK